MTTTYITTTIPYVNARPHLGFALELVQADVLARYPGTRQSRSCGLKQLERPLRVAGVVAVGGGDVDVAVQAQEADGQTAQ